MFLQPFYDLISNAFIEVFGDGGSRLASSESNSSLHFNFSMSCGISTLELRIIKHPPSFPCILESVQALLHCCMSMNSEKKEREWSSDGSLILLELHLLFLPLLQAFGVESSSPMVKSPLICSLVSYYASIRTEKVFLWEKIR